MLYFTIIQSHLDYFSSVWSNASNTDLNKMRVLQKRALRIVLRADFNTRSNELFRMAKVSPIDLRWKKTNVIFLFKIIHLPNMPTYISCRIQMKSNNYTLRNSLSQILLPKPKTEFLKRSFIYGGSKIVNSLLPDTRQSCNLNTFRSKISKEIFQ